MKISSTLALLLLGSTLSSAASLSVYQDQSQYSYKAKSTFIGLSKNVKAKCDGRSMETRFLPTCPRDKRLCKVLDALKESEFTLSKLKANSKVLASLLTLPQPKEFDAASWIDTAKRVGEEEARLLKESKQAESVVAFKAKLLNRQVPVHAALISGHLCKGSTELTIPYGYVTFSTRYEADISKKNEIKVSQYLSIVNRSGIDIKAEDAMFYYRPARQYVRAIHFNPWLVSKHTPVRYKKSMKLSRSAAVEDNMMVSMAGAPMMEPAPKMQASYLDAREYKVTNLDLPSTGMPTDVKLNTWSAELSCALKTYPYVNAEVFEVCTFEPKYQIDANRWKITSGKMTVNEKGTGEYDEGKYRLYTQIEDDIKVVRKPIVKNERETGIFGGTERKKDGYVLSLTNKSDKSKKVTVIERIPTSTNDEITVKLLDLKSDKKLHYKTLKDGKLQIEVTLAAKEHRKIEVLFEISYDKGLKIRY